MMKWRNYTNALVPQAALVLGIVIAAAISACASGTVELGDGEYLVVADRYGEDGWTPYLRVVVQDGTVDSREFDYRNSHGDYLSDQQYLNSSGFLAEFNGSGSVPGSAETPRQAFELLAAGLFNENRNQEFDGRVANDFRALEAELRAAQPAATPDEAGVPLQAAISGNRERIEPEEHPAVVLAFEDGRRNRTARRGGLNTNLETVGPSAVVSSHYLATEAAREALQAGGTAADAAFVMAAVLSMTEPWFSSILGGGTWALYYEAEEERVRSLDGVGPVASGATPELFADSDFRNRSGMHMANVPGAWSGWIDWLSEYGVLPLDELLAPAIEVGHNGFPASEALILWLRTGESLVRAYPDTQAIYMPDGEMPAVGDTIYQHAMAETFTELAEAYADARQFGERAALEAAREHYYRGPIAESIVTFSDEHGGLFALEDFTEFEDTGFADPVMTSYRGLDVYQNPPNSQGITMLIGLNILEEFDLASFGTESAEAIHLQVEALKLALADRNRHVADPEYVEVPIEELLSREHAQRQAERISMDSALEWPFEDVLAWNPNESNTTTFHVIDSFGNAAAVTTSLGAQFLVVGDTGIHINNRMRMMHHDASDPNVIEQGKKVRHTSNPYMVLREGQPYILGGNTGADFQPQGQLHQLVRLVDFEMTAEESVAQPRFVTTGVPDTSQPFIAEGGLGVEPEVPDEVREELVARGHRVEDGGIFGSANVIRVRNHAAGEIELGAEPREEVSSGELGPE